MRNALRELLALKLEDEVINRKRRHDLDQLAVEFKEFPDAEKFADDFLFGFMVADKKAIDKNKGLPSKRDSVFRMNMAVSVLPYRFNAVFHQSPLNAEPSPWKNSSTSALIHREAIHTAYQYPFAMAGIDCKAQPQWTKALLESIGELANVAGGHARSLYEMSPKSIVARISKSLVAGFDTYGFNENGEFAELSRINKDDLPGSEFWIGGQIARDMDLEERGRLEGEGVKFFDNPQVLLSEIGEAFLDQR
ncbi:MAG: hypothetical protein R2684_09720 [Pyrinomonadaceae bacterium]